MSACPDCQRQYRAVAGHCRGGKYGGCCRSFRGTKDFDAHRVGAFHDGSRRCLTDAEMLDKGWIQTDGLWASPYTQADALRVPLIASGSPL